MKRVLLLFSPFILFCVLYFIIGQFPNFLFNDVDIEGAYDTEKKLFGISAADGSTLIPSEYFAVHHAPWFDILSGLFYLMWIPLPAIFMIVLFLQGNYVIDAHFICAFTLVYLLGYVGYYVHPQAAPWYVMKYGFELNTSTPGNVGNFENFDALTGLPVFKLFYGQNANVFAAMPSLHAAPPLIAFIYAMKTPGDKVWRYIFGILCVGIWFSAIYSAHHYILDVIFGIIIAFVGIFTLEKIICKTYLWKKYEQHLL